MAANSNRLAGTVFLTVDGVSHLLVGDFEYDPSLVARTTEGGMDQIHGYSEKPVAPHISGTLRDMGGLSVQQINQMTNVTVVGELANGKTVIGVGMWTVDQQSVKSADGTFEVKWEGLQGSVKEQLAS